MAYSVVHFDKYHSQNQITTLGEHCSNIQIRNTLPHIDHTRTPLNRDYVDVSNGLYENWRQRREQVELLNNVKIKVRSNAVRMIAALATMSHDANVNIDDWVRLNQEWFEEKFSKDNIIGFTLHMDESTPHIHVAIIPIDDRNKLCCKSFINGPYSMKVLQNEYCKKMEILGLEHGEGRIKANKSSIEKFYKSIEEIEKRPQLIRTPEMTDQEYISALEERIKLVEMAFYKNRLDKNRMEDIIGSRVTETVSAYYYPMRFFDRLKEKEGKEKAKERIQTYEALEAALSSEMLDKILKLLFEQNHISLVDEPYKKIEDVHVQKQYVKSLNTEIKQIELE